MRAIKESGSFVGVSKIALKVTIPLVHTYHTNVSHWWQLVGLEEFTHILFGKVSFPGLLKLIPTYPRQIAICKLVLRRELIGSRMFQMMIY